MAAQSCGFARPAVFAALLLNLPAANTLAATISVAIGPASTSGMEAGPQREVSQTLGTVMQQIAAARGALQTHKGEAAKHSLVEAEAALRTIAETYGTGTASINLDTTHRNVDRDNVNTERQLHIRELKQLNEAKKALRQGRLDSASRIIDAVDYPLVFAEMDIPIGHTAANLRRAINLIDKGNLGQADVVLDLTQTAVQTNAGLFGGHF